MTAHGGLALGLLLFPEGRPLSPRWRPIVVVALAVLCLLGIVAALVPTLEAAPSLANPIGVPMVEPLIDPLIVAMLLIELVAVVSLVLRCVRSRGDERQQLKWVAYGAATFAVVTAAEIAGLDLRWFSAAGSRRAHRRDRRRRAAPPAVRHRPARQPHAGLRPADRRARRRVPAAVTVLQALLVGTGSQLAVAASTLAVAAAFRPLRRRVQDAVDRRFNRWRYDAVRTVDAFRFTMRDAVDLDRLAGELLTSVRQSVQPASAALWLRRPL